LPNTKPLYICRVVLVSLKDESLMVEVVRS